MYIHLYMNTLTGINIHMSTVHQLPKFEASYERFSGATDKLHASGLLLAAALAFA